jgi:membrane protease subunit HflC
MKTIVALVIVILAAVVVIPASMYTVPEGWQAVITQFGDPVRVRTEAGLYFKPPFIQEIHRLEKRLLPWDGDPENMQTLDKKRIFIDVWARWRIVEPMKFFQAVRTENRGYKILDDLVDSAVRDVVARNNLIEVVRSSNRELLYESDELARDAASSQDRIAVGRAKMEAEILTVASVGLKEQYGMELSVVHIKRVNYIESVRTTVYDRMKSERIRIAKLFESEAEEEKNRILGLTTKELDGIKGEQQQRAAEIRGRAKAEVIRIAADAYGKSPEFYGFLRHLETYKRTLGTGTRLVLSTDNELLRYLRGSTEGINPSIGGRPKGDIGGHAGNESTVSEVVSTPSVD